MYIHVSIIICRKIQEMKENCSESTENPSMQTKDPVLRRQLCENFDLPHLATCIFQDLRNVLLIIDKCVYFSKSLTFLFFSLRENCKRLSGMKNACYCVLFLLALATKPDSKCDFQKMDAFNTAPNSSMARTTRFFG